MTYITDYKQVYIFALKFARKTGRNICLWNILLFLAKDVYKAFGKRLMLGRAGHMKSYLLGTYSIYYKLDISILQFHF